MSGLPKYEVLAILCMDYLRMPQDTIIAADGTATHTFVPPLTVAEQAIYADLTAMAKSSATSSMTLAEYQAIKPFLASEVAWMAITRNGFVNLAEADMRRAVYDIITAEVRLARAARRDG